MSPLKIAILTTDNREHWQQYELPAPISGTAPEALLQGFADREIAAEVEVHVVSCVRQPVTSPQMLADNIFYHSVEIPAWGMAKTLYVPAVLAMRKKLAEIQPDIVHGQGTERDCALSAVFSDFPNVLTIHGNMREIAKMTHARFGSFYWLAARLETVALRRAQGVICITKYTENLVKPLNRRAWLLPNAVDERYFKVVRNRAGARKVLLCVGMICERKNQNRLIQVMDLLWQRHGVELRFLGQVSERTSYERDFLALTKKRPWCRLVGFVGRDELARELAGAYGLILPSIEDNCPMAVLEAMAAGVPVAAGEVGGVPELIMHEKNGWLFNPHDENSMCKTLAHFLTDEKSITDAAVRAKSEAQERFLPKIIAQKHLEIYREVLGMV